MRQWSFVVLAALCTVPFLTTRAARAAGNATGSLGAGGRAKGDISRTVGETDQITVDLVEGASLAIRFGAGFQPTITLTDPHGAPVDIGAPDGTRLTVAALPVPSTGTYTFSISSADGSQGFYSLAVSQRWARTQTASGTGAQRVDVSMPGGARLAAVVRGTPGQPEISALEDPAGTALLTAPIVTSSRVAKLAPTSTAAAGVYHLTFDTSDHTSPWTATVTRLIKPAPLTRLTLSNGLDVVSYAGDGVGDLLSHRCGRCHGWAYSYRAARTYIFRALPRILSGSMPPDGPLPRTDVALIRAWIATGREP